MFSEKDLQQISQRGSSLDTVKNQIKHFQEGFPFLKVIKAATINDGLIRLTSDQIDHYIESYEKQLPNTEVVKFVPASGAASRMFKALFAYMTGYQADDPDFNADIVEKHPDIAKFFAQIQKFAFFKDLEVTFGQSINHDTSTSQYANILAALLTEAGMDYGGLPKGLLKFHQYTNISRTPVEEHLVEGANYGKDGDGQVRLHFTVSPEHRSKFIEHISDVKEKYESALGVTYQISFSEQKPSTDTIAVDMENQPFRNEDESLLFRPGGHGALLANLDEIDGDIIFIKNIDNVVPDHIKGETYRFKKALAGLLLEYQATIFGYLKQINAGKGDVSEISNFVEKSLCTQLPEAFSTKPDAEKLAYLATKLNRPIRVCGMVKNEGEPGGGPFWAENSDGTVSLQIAESAQIDKGSQEQLSILQNATHFNPVDLVCGVRNTEGKKFDLMPFRDPQTGFIAFKSKGGRDLKAQELPGLWNGSMSDWNTLFVEVPIITFNPVKKVTDLLRPEHQD